MKKLSKIIPIILSVNLLVPMTSYASPLTLEDAINTAIKNNFGLQSTRMNEYSAKANLEKAKGEAGFAISVSDNINFSKQEAMESNSTNALSLGGKYSIYDGGRNKNNIKNSELNINIAELQTEKATNDLVMNVSKAYYDAMEARDTVKVNQDTVKNYVAHLNNVQKLFEGGAKARVDVLRTEVELANAQQKLTKSQVNYDTKIAILMNYIQDVKAKENPTLTSSVKSVPISNNLNYYLNHARENNVILKIDKYKLKQAELNLDTAYAGYKPNVDFSANVGKSFDVYNSRNGEANFTSGVSIGWNIFDSGVTKSNVEEKKVLLNSARLNMLNDEQNIDLNVKSAFLNLIEAQSRFESTEKAIQKAEEKNRIALVKYTAGEGLLLDIIDAQVALSTAKLNFCNAQYDYARHKVELDNAIGTTIFDKEIKIGTM